MKKSYKFRGGIRIGMWANSWPSGLLEFDQNTLIMKDVLIRKKCEFTKNDNIRIDVKKVFPILGYGIKISHTKKNYNKILYFWYTGLHFKKLVNALKELDWLR